MDGQKVKMICSVKEAREIRWARYSFRGSASVVVVVVAPTLTYLSSNEVARILFMAAYLVQCCRLNGLWVTNGDCRTLGEIKVYKDGHGLQHRKYT